LLQKTICFFKIIVSEFHANIIGVRKSTNYIVEQARIFLAYMNSSVKFPDKIFFFVQKTNSFFKIALYMIMQSGVRMSTNYIQEQARKHSAYVGANFLRKIPRKNLFFAAKKQFPSL